MMRNVDYFLEPKSQEKEYLLWCYADLIAKGVLREDLQPIDREGLISLIGQGYDIEPATQDAKQSLLRLCESMQQGVLRIMMGMAVRQPVIGRVLPVEPVRSGQIRK